MHFCPLTTLFYPTNNNMEIYAKKLTPFNLYTKKNANNKINIYKITKPQNKKPKHAKKNRKKSFFFKKMTLGHKIIFLRIFIFLAINHQHQITQIHIKCEFK